MDAFLFKKRLLTLTLERQDQLKSKYCHALMLTPAKSLLVFMKTTSKAILKISVFHPKSVAFSNQILEWELGHPALSKTLTISYPNKSVRFEGFHYNEKSFFISVDENSADETSLVLKLLPLKINLETRETLELCFSKGKERFYRFVALRIK